MKFNPLWKPLSNQQQATINGGLSANNEPWEGWAETSGPGRSVPPPPYGGGG